MSKKLCILQANCQGEGLKQLLEATPPFAREYEILYYVNYKGQHIPPEAMDGCALFLHQHLSPKWGELSTDQILKRLPARARSICLPNFFFKGYWPHWTNHFKGIEFADSLLESLLAKGLAHHQVLYLYLKGAPALLGNVEDIAQASLEKEREKEKYTPIKYTHLMEKNWRNSQIFLTVNHPANFLFFHMASELLKILGLGELSEEARKNFVNPQGDFWLPIHPVVGKMLSLPFVYEDREYECFGGKITHANYISRYLGCRRHDVFDLTTVLRQEKDRAKAISEK